MSTDMTKTTELTKPTTLAEAKSTAENVGMVNFGGGFQMQVANLGELMNFAQLMAGGGPMVGKPFQRNPGACLGIIMQAGRVGMSAFALSQKAYLVNDVISYEAQAIMAMIYGSKILEGRLKFSYEGEGTNRVCIVHGVIKGDPEVLEKRSPMLKNIKPQNSPLWKTDPDQQQAYYTARTWCRLFCPDVLMGVYSVEEMQHANSEGGLLDSVTREQGVDGLRQRIEFARRAEEAAEPIDVVDSAPAETKPAPQPKPATSPPADPPKKPGDDRQRPAADATTADTVAPAVEEPTDGCPEHVRESFHAELVEALASVKDETQLNAIMMKFTKESNCVEEGDHLKAMVAEFESANPVKDGGLF